MDGERYCFELQGVPQLHNDLPFLPEKMKIKIVEKFLGNFHNKKGLCYKHKKLKTITKS